MAQRILITDKLQGPEFASEERTRAIDRLRDYAEVEFYAESEFGAEHAEGVVGVLGGFGCVLARVLRDGARFAHCCAVGCGV